MSQALVLATWSQANTDHAGSVSNPVERIGGDFGKSVALAVNVTAVT